MLQQKRARFLFLTSLMMTKMIDAKPIFITKGSTITTVLVGRSTTNSTSPSIIAVAIVVPIVIIAFLILIAFTLCRKLRINSSTQDVNENRRMRRIGERIKLKLREYFLHGNTSRNVTGTTENDQSNDNNSSSTTSNSNRRRRRDRNGLRRTDSGNSVKTLPEYKISLAENEMMLYKAVQTENEDNSSPEIILEIGGNDSPEMSMISASNQQDDGVRGTSQEEGQSNSSLVYRNSISSMAMNGISALRRSLRRNEVTGTNTEQRDAEEEANEGNEMERLNDSNAQPIIDETPTYESLYPTVTLDGSDSMTNHIVPEPNSRPPIRGTAAFKNLFRWNGGNDVNFTPINTSTSNHRHRRFASTASVLSSTTGMGNYDLNSSYNGSSLSLVPTRSIDIQQQQTGRTIRPSTSQRFRGIIFPGTGGNNTSTISLLSAMSSMDNNNATATATNSSGRPSGSSSRQQVHQRNISAPISIRRLQFEPPVAGFTDQQMAFLTSVESLGKYAIPLEEDGGGISDNGIPGTTTILPSFEQIARSEEENRIENIQRNAPTLTSGERFKQDEIATELNNQNLSTTLQLPVGPSSSNSNNNETNLN